MLNRSVILTFITLTLLTLSGVSFASSATSTGVRLVSDFPSNGYYFFAGTSNSLFGTTTDALTSVSLASGQTQWTYNTGLGIRSAALGDGLVFLGTDQGEVIGVNQTTGIAVWNYSAASTTTLIFAEGEVFANSQAYGLYALNANGSLLWSSTLIVGTSSTPTYASGVVYDNSFGSSAVLAFNATTGAELWSSPNLGGTSPSSPIVSGNQVFEGTSGGYVYSLSVSTGAIEWSYYTGQDTYAVSVYNGELIAANNLFTTLYILNVSTGAKLWSISKVQETARSFAVTASNTELAALESNGVVHSYHLLTGAKAWEYGPASYYTGLTQVGSKLLFVTSDNILHGLDAKTGGQQFYFTLPGSLGGNGEILSDGNYAVISSPTETYVMTV
jgi:outer membrane protein assembly factor BamB